MNINQIKELDKTKVTFEQWEEIRHSNFVKRVSLQGIERGITRSSLTTVQALLSMFNATLYNSIK